MEGTMVRLLASAVLAFYLLKTAHGESVEELILEQGYPLELHEIVTEDGYILTVHRIPHGKRSQGTSRRSVMLQHGLLASSACWVLSSPEKALAFILADDGYDVWLPNNRGNTYSRKHKTLDPDKKAFWNFSFHEMGYYDLPAIIDYILNETRRTGLYYVGHSEGTTQFFVLASTRPEYNKKIIHMSALAPVAFLDHTRGSLRPILDISKLLEILASITHTYEVFSSKSLFHWIETKTCKAEAINELICENIIFLITGYDSKQLNVSLLPIITDFTPAGASVKQFQHFAQVAEDGGKFRQFDYGRNKNLKIYNQETPPEYNLSKIDIPIMLHYASNDWISGIPDVVKLNASLPNSRSLLVPFRYFNHIDFLWASEVRTLLYEEMIKVMRRY